MRYVCGGRGWVSHILMFEQVEGFSRKLVQILGCHWSRPTKQ
jgi:hypothetical protein